MPFPINTRALVLRPFLLIIPAAFFAVAAPRANAQQPKAVKAKGKTLPLEARYVTPQPPYPFQALQRRLEGRGIVEVQFGAQGEVTSVVLVKSFGSEVLDSNTTNWIKHKWKSLEGKPSVRHAELVYAIPRQNFR